MLIIFYFLLLSTRDKDVEIPMKFSISTCLEHRCQNDMHEDNSGRTSKKHNASLKDVLRHVVSVNSRIL